MRSSVLFHGDIPLDVRVPRVTPPHKFLQLRVEDILAQLLNSDPRLRRIRTHKVQEFHDLSNSVLALLRLVLSHDHRYIRVHNGCRHRSVIDQLHMQYARSRVNQDDRKLYAQHVHGNELARYHADHRMRGQDYCA